MKTDNVISAEERVADTIELLSQSEEKASEKKDIETSIDCCKKIVALAQKAELPQLTLKHYKKLLINYCALESNQQALFYGKKLASLAEELNDVDSLEIAFVRIGGIHWNTSNYKSALPYLNKAVKLQTKIKDPERSCICFRNVAMTYTKLQEYEKASLYFDKAYSSAKKNGSTRLAAEIIYWKGLLESEQNNLKKAIRNFFKSEDLFRKDSDNYGIAITLNTVGSVFRKLKNRKKALHYFKLAKTYAEKSECFRENLQADVYNNIGLIHYDDKHYDKALDNYLLSLEHRRNTGHKDHESITLLNIANIYIKKQEYNTALEYALKSHEIKEKLNNNKKLASSTKVLLKIYLSLGDLQQAKNYVSKLEELSPHIIDNSISLEAFEMISEYYETTGDYKKAHLYLQKHLKLYREISCQDLRQKIVNQEHKYRIDRMRLRNKSKIERERVKTVLAMATTTMHQINQPLMVIQGNAELLLMKHKDFVAKDRKYLEDIIGCIDKVKETLTLLTKVQEIKYKSYLNDDNIIDYTSK